MKLKVPPGYQAISAETEALGFTMPSAVSEGALLRSLAASKPGGRLLELGTGTGLATAWLLDGMDASAKLWSIDVDPSLLYIANQHLGHDERLTLVQADGLEYLSSIQDYEFDLIFADAMPGKYDGLELALNLLKSGGLYVIDDMLPQPNWPEEHGPRVDRLINVLHSRDDMQVVSLNWSTGVMIGVKI